MLKAQPPHQ
jgi:hypothetical protein